MNLLAVLPDFVKIPASMVVGAGLAFYPVKWYGESLERVRNEAQTLSRTVEVLRDRQITDAQVAVTADPGLCQFMGLSAEDYQQCVRRVETLKPVAEHDRNDNPNGPTIRRPSGEPQQLRR